MLHQVPREQLLAYWPYFKNHKFRNPLAQNLTWSNVEGFVDDLDNPDVIMFLCQSWACYLAGNRNAEHLKEFLEKIPERAFIYVPTEEWEPVLKTQWPYLEYLPRTEFSAKNLSLPKIQRLLTPLPEGFQMKKADVDTANQLLSQDFSDHWTGVVNFLGSPEYFVKEGIGYCVQEGEKIVSIAMGFMASLSLTQSIELDIATLSDYHGRGFATLVGAKLIEYLLKKGIEPHWDTETTNLSSIKLAKRLRFTHPEPYRCYYWRKTP